MVLCSFLFGHHASAQEDSAGDHGSRAVRKADESEASVKPRASKKRKVKPRGSEFSFSYGGGVFGGVYAQQSALGQMLNAQVTGGLANSEGSLSLALEYGFDPFSTKTFNFPDEEGTTVPVVSRLTQPMHEISATLTREQAWSRWLGTGLRTRADAWYPKIDSDQRRAFRIAPQLRLGRSRGPYAEFTAEGFYKSFPNYQVADRRLDQVGVDSTVELGYSFGAYSRVGVGTELDYTYYVDARYDQLNLDQSVSRSPHSKSYLERSPYVAVALRPVKALRTKLSYAYELNDSTNYNRRMTGRIGGELVPKFIPDYYDYTRHRLRMSAQLRPTAAVVLRVLSEFWLRKFDTYEARDVDNTWLGERRQDVSVEAGLDASYRLWKGKVVGRKHALYLTAFGSHLRRSSNMRREVSLATNFSVTRAFLGVEFRDL